VERQKEGLCSGVMVEIRSGDFGWFLWFAAFASLSFSTV
jgi:hypothetical protein